jgi:anti-sigma regulatory factor (Ser/Thr protein kinase)
MDKIKHLTTIVIPSDPKYLSLLRTATSKIANIAGITEPAAEDIKLAVDEACSNVIKYAYKGNRNREIGVKFGLNKKDLMVIIEDSGVKADPECLKGRSLDDIRPGGLGLHLIKRAFDVFRFDRRKKKGNRLILIRYAKRTS